MRDRVNIAFALAASFLAAWAPALLSAGAQEDEGAGAAQSDAAGETDEGPAADDESADESAAESESPETPEAADDRGEAAGGAADDDAHAAAPAEVRETVPDAQVIHGRGRLGVPREAAVKVSMKVVYASREGRSIDHRIRDLARGFQKEFKADALSKFVLLDSREFKLGPGVVLPVELPGGRRLKIENGGVKGRQVVLGLEIEELIRTTVLLTPDGKFSFGGPKYRYGGGMIIIVVKAKPAGK